MQPTPGEGSLDEFDELLEAFDVSRRAFLWAVVGWVAIQGVTYHFWNENLPYWACGQAFAVAYLATFSIWSARSYARAMCLNVGLACYIAGFASIVPFLIIFGFVAMQADLVKRLQRFGLTRARWRFDPVQVTQVRMGLEPFDPSDAT